MPLTALLLPLTLAQGPKLSVPKATWEPIFFQSIDERASMSRLPSLRKTLLPTRDIEVRVWSGFGLTYLEGIILKRGKGTWTAAWVPPTPPTKKEMAAVQPIPLSTPIAVDLWRRLQNEGILSLPDESELPDDGIVVLDGTSYVVEYQREGVYRTYMYSNPAEHKSWPEAKRILAIDRLLQQTLGIAPRRIAYSEKIWGRRKKG